VRIRQGLGGNVYAFSRDKGLVAGAARAIGKAVGAVYFNRRFGLWAIRCRSKAHRLKLLRLKEANADA